MQEEKNNLNEEMLICCYQAVLNPARYQLRGREILLTEEPTMRQERLSALSLTAMESKLVKGIDFEGLINDFECTK